VTEQEVRHALTAVNDPHIPVSLERMGMLRDIDIDADGTVRVQVCIPCSGCPGASMIRDGVREAVGALPGVTKVVVEEGWHMSWSRDMVDSDVRDLMHKNGVQI